MPSAPGVDELSATRFVDREVPHSSGTARPRIAAPRYACDCHMHIYDSRIPGATGATLPHADASVSDYRLLQERLGLERTVIVTPSLYGFDNRVTCAALNELGNTARGIAVVHPDVSDTELHELDQSGVVGVRFNQSIGGVTTFDMIERVAKRIASRGWHIQVALRAPMLVEHEGLLASLPVPVVLDHFAGVDATAGPSDGSLQALLRLLHGGNTWLKLSGAYLRSRTAASDYADLTDLARQLIAAAPGHVLWGSDWPHPTQVRKPDDASLLDLLLDWSPDERTRHAILVDNPTSLYRF